jgi:hypothetical protein
MRRNPAFDLLESICVELADYKQRVIDEQALPSDLREKLRKKFNETADGAAFDATLEWLRAHFAARRSVLPFEWSQATREFSVTDDMLVSFIASAKNGRSVGGPAAKEFEIQSTRLLARKLTGELHTVGDPRQGSNNHRTFVKHLMTLGFDKKCLEARDKDGGLDILWLPPLGAVPIRPVVVLQCKNSYFNESEAAKSAGRARRTLSRHSHIRGHELVYAVFNDYIDEQFLGAACGWTFVPLGLSDLALITPPDTAVVL